MKVLIALRDTTNLKYNLVNIEKLRKRLGEETNGNIDEEMLKENKIIRKSTQNADYRLLLDIGIIEYMTVDKDWDMNMCVYILIIVD